MFDGGLVTVPLVAFAVTHYAAKALPLVDQRLRDLFLRGSQDAAAQAEAEELLAERMAAEPEQARALVAAALERLPDPRAPSPKLDALWRITQGLLFAIRQLRPPLVALPGFHHSPMVVSVFDARGDISLEPYRTWQTEDGPGTLSLGDPLHGILLSGYGEAVRESIPRIFLIAVPNQQARVRVLRRLDEAFSAEDPRTSVNLLGHMLHRLAQVPPDRVSAASWIRESSLETENLDGTPGSSYPIDSPDGITLLRAALIERIVAVDTQAARWRAEAEAWSQSVGAKPADDR